jgi:uncharacterized membrane protein
MNFYKLFTQQFVSNFTLKYNLYYRMQNDIPTLYILEIGSSVVKSVEH